MLVGVCLQETEWIMPVEVARVKKKQADEAAAAHEKARQAAAEQRAFAQRQMQQAAGANHATVAAKGGGWYNVAGECCEANIVHSRKSWHVVKGHSI